MNGKDNEIQILTKDLEEYKRQLLQITDLQNQNDQKIFTSLQQRNECLKEEVFRYRKEIESLNNTLLDLGNVQKHNEILNTERDEAKKRYLYFKDKVDKVTKEKNTFETEYIKEVKKKVFLEQEWNELTEKYQLLQRKHFEMGRKMQTEMNLLKEAHKLDKQMDQNIILQQQRKLQELQSAKPRGQTSNQQNWRHQQRIYQQEQYRRQQWLVYQQQQQLTKYQQMFPPPPPLDEDHEEK
eukprot:425208_1